MKKRVLITGANGFVGRHFVEHFLTHTDWEIVGLININNSELRLKIENKYKKINNNFEVFCCDLEKPISKGLISEIGEIDYIFNIASDADINKSIQYPVEFFNKNANIMLNMLEYARIIKPSFFYHLSSNEIYGPANSCSRKEWSLHAPQTIYAASKAAQNDICVAYWRSYNVPIVLCQTMNIIGERMNKNKFIPVITESIMKGKKVKIFGNEKSQGVRNYTYVKNLADSALFLVKNTIPTKFQKGINTPDSYNVCDKDKLTNLELAMIISKKLNKKLNYEFVDFDKTRPGHDENYSIDCSKIEKLGWKPFINLNDSIDKTIKYIADNIVYEREFCLESQRFL